MTAKVRIIQPQNKICLNYSPCLTMNKLIPDNYFTPGLSDNLMFEEDIEHKQKHKTYSLFDNPELLKFPTDVINRAEEISQRMHRANNNRNGRRLQRQFTCLYYAHRELGIENYSPQNIADEIGMPYKQIHKAITDFSALKSGYKFSQTNRSYAHPSSSLAGKYATDMSFTDDAIEHVKSIISDAISSDPDIKRRQSATIAVGAIAACAFLRGKDIDFTRLSKISKISQSTIKLSRDQILTAYNMISV